MGIIKPTIHLSASFEIIYQLDLVLLFVNYRSGRIPVEAKPGMSAPKAGHCQQREERGRSPKQKRWSDFVRLSAIRDSLWHHPASSWRKNVTVSDIIPLLHEEKTRLEWFGLSRLFETWRKSKEAQNEAVVVANRSQSHRPALPPEVVDLETILLFTHRRIILRSICGTCADAVNGLI